MKFNGRFSAVLITVSAVFLAGCGNGQTASNSMSQSAARASMFHSIRSLSQGGSGLYFDDDLGDFLPQQKVQIDGQAPIPLSPGIVMGSVTDASVTSAYVLDDADGPPATEGTPVDSDDPDADWRIITARLKIDQEWTDQMQVGQTITINVSIRGADDSAAFVKGLESLDSAVVALQAHNQIGDADYAVGRQGALLGEIESGEIRFPALDSDRSFVGALKNPRALDQAAKQPRGVIHVDEGVVQRGG